MKKTFSLFTLLFATFMLGHSQASKNITLVAHVPYADLCSDVVGYATPSTEYAILGHFTGTSILSLATPSNPVLLFEIPGIGSQWHEVEIYQDYAYVVNEAGDGLRIIDLSGLPNSVQHKDTVINGLVTGHTLMAAGNRLYIFGSNIDNGGVSVFSLADPWKPVYIGGYANQYVHDAYVRGDTGYLGDIYNGFMEMVDLRNLTAPVLLGSVSTPSHFTHNTWLNDAGNICFTTDEVNAAYVTAFDVSNPSNISEVSRYRSSLSNGQAIPHNVKVLNDFLVTAYYKDGVNIADARYPNNPVEVGYYDTCPDNGPGFDGNWGLDCYLPSGLILAADMSSGFFVLQPNYVRACYLEGQVTDFSNGNPITGADITILSSSVADQSNNLGDYAMGIADGGVYNVRYSKYGYRDTTVTMTFANGVLLVQDIALRPNPRVAMVVNVIEQGSGNPIPNAQISFQEILSGIPTNYVTDSQGHLVDNNFMSSNYHLIVGQWGYITNGIDTNITSNSNSITIALAKGYYDDFTFDFGWTTSGNATDGMWERGEPIGTPFYSIFANPEFDDSTDYGDECYVTGNQGGDAHNNDVDGGMVILTSPIMDLSSYTNPWLIFDYWFESLDNNGLHGFRDSLLILIDNGATVTRVWHVQDEIRPFWTTDTVQIASYLPFTSTTRIIVRCGDRQFDNIVEGAIDKVRIEDQTFVGQQVAIISQPSLRAFPNPSHQDMALWYDLSGQKNGSLAVVDLDGRVVWETSVTSGKGTVQIQESLPSGMYFATLKADGLRLATTKIVRN